MDPLRFEFVLDSAAGGGIRIPFDAVEPANKPETRPRRGHGVIGRLS